jgi:hypothetical protein
VKPRDFMLTFNNSLNNYSHVLSRFQNDQHCYVAALWKTQLTANSKKWKDLAWYDLMMWLEQMSKKIKFCYSTVLPVYFRICDICSIFCRLKTLFPPLKGQCHEIFCYWFISWIVFPTSLW